MIPFAYALRNLSRRRARTIVTITGIALTTLLVIVMGAFASGLDRAGGTTATSTHTMTDLTGRPPRTVVEFAYEHADAFR